MLITLGFDCNVTFLNQKLHIKKQTGVFEWFQIRKLQYITDVINTLTINPESNIISKKDDENIYLLNTDYFSCHYNAEEYKIIFKTRYNRFIHSINNEENIYFIRINPVGINTSKNEIELFIESIKTINPHITFNFLLIDTIHNDYDINSITIDIDNVIFHHKYFYTKDYTDCFMRNSQIQESYKKILKDVGFNINQTNNISFNDKSEF